MGTAARSIRKVVLTLSGLIGVIGIVSGSVLALGLSLIQKRFEVIPLPADAYYMTAAPIQIQPLDYVVVAVATFCLCLVFAYIPARFAARLDPIQVIRFQ
jgi:lipoprotein-releasing system permease protein